jgi:chemotaxis protein histidine kinase CheA
VLGDWRGASFRQQGRETELPISFIQRRLAVLRAFYEDPADSITEAYHVMENSAPMSWEIILRWRGQTTSGLISLVLEYEDALIQDWEDSQRRARHRERQDRFSKQRSAHLAEVEEESESEAINEESPHEVLAVNAQRWKSKGTSNRNPGGSRPEPFRKKPIAPSKLNWPDKPPYPKDDSIVSAHPPPKSGCLACGSDKHWVRDCRYYGEATVKYSHIAESQEDVEEYTNMILSAGSETAFQ